MYQNLYILFLLSIIISCDSITNKNEDSKNKFIKINSYQISGYVSDTNSDLIYLVNSSNIKIDSQKIDKKNQFKFKGSIKKPKFYKLQLKGNPRLFSFVLENSLYNSIITDKSSTIIGGNLNNKYIRFLSNKNNFAIQKSELLEDFSMLNIGLRQYLNQVDSIRSIEKKELIKFIVSNHENILASKILLETNLNSRQALIIKEKLTKSTKNKRLIRQLDEIIDNLKLAEAEDRILKRKPTPLFSGVNLQGKQTKLKDIIQGKKLFLIDFWASWCPPCREISPKLKILYQKYRNKGFDILTVSEDRSVSDWKNGVFIDGIENWHHIYDDFNRISSLFNVGALPHLVLIDENGKIINHKISMKSLEDYLEKTFETKENNNNG